MTAIQFPQHSKTPADSRSDDGNRPQPNCTTAFFPPMMRHHNASALPPKVSALSMRQLVRPPWMNPCCWRNSGLMLRASTAFQRSRMRSSVLRNLLNGWFAKTARPASMRFGIGISPGARNDWHLTAVRYGLTGRPGQEPGMSRSPAGAPGLSRRLPAS